MPLTAEQRRTRARNAADARHHPGADPADLERERTDRAIDDPVALARAARIVRVALERGRLARADLDGGADVAS